MKARYNYVSLQGIRFWDERAFWHEIILKIIPTFGRVLVTNLTGQRKQPDFSPVKIPYRTHSILNTTSRLHRIML